MMKQSTTLTKGMLCAGISLGVVGCGATSTADAVIERLDASERHARTVSYGAEQTCEAARLALLSQGYLITLTQGLELRAQESFQPARSSHVQMDFRVTCVAVPAGETPMSTIFVSAVQERYELKKSSNAASVGLPALGTISLPFSTSNDAMVKVSSETVISGSLYERFFELMARYLDTARPRSVHQDPAGSTQPPH